MLPPRYSDPESIGQGGMGNVFAASDTELGRRVAIKVLAARFAGDDASRRRFEREALAAARLSSHPHVVTIYDVGESDGRPFIVMELLTGGTVADRIAQGRVARGDALRWLEQAAQALDAAHEDGVVHRDVKSSNLLLDDQDDVHVADFGIARVLDKTRGLTETGTVLGTAGYLSPEQARGQTATSASDVYSLGVVASELLNGHRTPATEAVLERALADDPSERYPTARELVAALEDALDATAPLPARSLHRHRRWIVPALVALGLLAGGALAGALLAGGDSRTQTQERTVVRTRTLPGTTVSEVATVTTVVPAPVEKHGHGPKPKKEHKHG